MSPTEQPKPLIGITTYGRNKNGNFYLPAEYIDAVRRAGGLPILLPPGESRIEPILHRLDGLMFAGGGDIDPQLYGGEWHPTVSDVDPERDAFELKLVQRVLHHAVPVLGICRGAQMLNVATGGELVVHVPEEYGLDVRHRTEHGKEIEHSVYIEPTSRLAEILGVSQLAVISKHHQALRTVSSEWQIVARAEDGVVEAMQHRRHPWMLAVLWHAEMAHDDPLQMKLLRAFVQAASGPDAARSSTTPL